MSKIQIPTFTPRDYQVPVLKAFDAGLRKFVLRWHRRAGKDEICLNMSAKGAMTTIGNYWHMLPDYSQARKAIWTAVNPKTGRKRIDEAFPLEIRKKTSDDSMYIEFINGSTWQLVGSDNYDKLVGAGTVGLVFSEYALANPAAWDYFRPMIAENGGWAFFISTVRGRNHFYKLGEYAKSNPKEWYFQEVNADESGVFTPEQLQSEKNELMSQLGEDEGIAKFNQEYFNDPNAQIPGAYYTKYINKIRVAGQIGRVPYLPHLPVTTAWDLGIGDSTAIWFVQVQGKEVRVFDYMESSGKGLEYYYKYLLEKDCIYNKHILPHDADNSELGTGKRRIDVLKGMGLKNAIVLPRISVDDGIHAARQLIPNCYIDESNCKKGLDALENYHREWDDELKVFSNKPKHDWSSHGADAFRYLALGLTAHEQTKVKHRPQFAINDFSL